MPSSACVGRPASAPLSLHLCVHSFPQVTRDKAVIKPAKGTRDCKCKVKLETKQLGPGMFQQFQRQASAGCGGGGRASSWGPACSSSSRGRQVQGGGELGGAFALGIGGRQVARGESVTFPRVGSDP